MSTIESGVTEQVFIKENLIQTQEYLSPSKRYKLIVETYKTGKGTWNYTKGTIYSSSNHWVGEIRRNYPHFPYLFFSKKDISGNYVEYLISGRDYTSQTIIHCETGHVYDNTDDKNKDPFCWSQMWQVDQNTLCVCGCYWGGSYIYSFFDFSNLNLGWKRLDVKCPNGLEMPKYDYVLTNNDLVGQSNYPDPVIQNGNIIFTVKETRIFGIGINNRGVKEIDIEINDYKEQEDMEDGFKIPYSKSKTYQIDMVRMKYRRVDNHVELFEFWRDEKQMELDEIGYSDSDIQHTRSQRCNDIYERLVEKFMNKYHIRAYLTIDHQQISEMSKDRYKWNISIIPKHTRSYQYIVDFDDQKNTEIHVKYYNFKFKEQNRTVSIWDENGIVDLIV